jgi:hypothetical protein
VTDDVDLAKGARVKQELKFQTAEVLGGNAFVTGISWAASIRSVELPIWGGVALDGASIEL